MPKKLTRSISIQLKDTVSAVPRVLQIFVRRDYYISSFDVKTHGGFKQVTVEFPADFNMYKTVVDQLQNLIDVVEIEHNVIDYTYQEILSKKTINQNIYS